MKGWAEAGIVTNIVAMVNATMSNFKRHRTTCRTFRVEVCLLFLYGYLRMTTIYNNGLTGTPLHTVEVASLTLSFSSNTIATFYPQPHG